MTNSINNVARAQQSQMITNRVLGSILLGATQQVSCSSCGGGFASFGSFALGGSGRWSLSDNTTLIGGISYNQWSASGISVYDAPSIAGALIYDFVNWGSSRPFLEAGLGLIPYEQVKTTRIYPNGDTTGTGYSTATDRSASLFGRAGWVDRLTPIDEAAAYVDLGRSWMQTGGYSEQMTAINPFPATVPNGLSTLNVARLGGQYTHLFNGNTEVNVTAAVAYGFGAGAGAPFNVFEFGTIAPGAIADSAWFEYGARVRLPRHRPAGSRRFPARHRWGLGRKLCARRRRGAVLVLTDTLQASPSRFALVASARTPSQPALAWLQ